jgi:hypothetical protein
MPLENDPEDFGLRKCPLCRATNPIDAKWCTMCHRKISIATLDDAKAGRYVGYGCLWGVCFSLGGVVLVLISSQAVFAYGMGGQVAPQLYVGIVASVVGILGAIIFFIAAWRARKPRETTHHQRTPQ